MNVQLVAPNIKEARKELGLGMPPDVFGSNADQALADQCNPNARIVIAEVARWRIDSSVADSAIAATFGDRVNVWGTSDGNAPPGVTSATNTLATAGMPSADLIIRGISVRFLVTPEARSIPGNLGVPAGVANLFASADVMTLNDQARSLGLAQGQAAPIPATLLYGLPTWKAAFAFVNGYEFAFLRNHTDRLLQEPLTAMAHIEPFAEAEAAGNAFSTNQDVTLAYNQRLVGLGMTQQFAPVFFKRLGSLTDGNAANTGIFTPTRDGDTSITMFGGVGVPQNPLQHDPYLFTTPLYWPMGAPITLQFIANDPTYQAEFQRWLSVTGGSGGQAGNDLNLPFSNVVGFSGTMPTTAAGDAMLEQTLDANQVTVNQQVNTNRALCKAGPMVIEVGLIAQRVTNPSWGPVLARAIKAGALSAPMGYGGTVSGYMTQ